MGISGTTSPQITKPKLIPTNFSSWKPAQGNSTSHDIIHERLISKDKAKLLSGTLLHYSQDKIAMSLQKMNDYSSATSTILMDKNRKTSLIKAALHKEWTFFRGFIMRLGFLDGRRGYLIAKLSAYGSYFKYVKLWEKIQYEKK